MIWLLPLAFLSGVLGRMGGAGKSGSWYDRILDTKWRDVGCSLVIIAACWIMLGWHPVVYLSMIVLHWATFSTYWDDSKNKFLDWINKHINWMYPKDNLWLSGFIVGMAAFPLCFVDSMFLWIVPIRSVVLMIIWGCLNKCLPHKGLLIWRRDVVEEFCRYAISL